MQNLNFWDKNRLQIIPWLFLLPTVIMFAVFVLYPVLASLGISFYKWDGLGLAKFIGWDNYRELLDDANFLISLKNNLLWLVFFMLAPVIGLFLALYLNQKILAMRFYKSMFFFPFVISQVVVGLVFTWFYDPGFGLLAKTLSLVGQEPIPILGDENLVTFGIIAAGIWPQIAYCMILYLTGLTGVDTGIIESARIDGARRFTMLFHIILPQLKPATFIAIVVTVIGALRSFDMVAIMTAGGPYGSSRVLAYYMYEQSLFNYRMGYGAAIATVLFLIMSVYIAYFLYKMLRDESKI